MNILLPLHLNYSPSSKYDDYVFSWEGNLLILRHMLHKSKRTLTQLNENKSVFTQCVQPITCFILSKRKLR